MRYNELWLRIFVPTHGMCSPPSTGDTAEKWRGTVKKIPARNITTHVVIYFTTIYSS